MVRIYSVKQSLSVVQMRGLFLNNKINEKLQLLLIFIIM